MQKSHDGKYIYNMDMEEKENKLKEQLKSLGKVAVAVSGGVDSSYLLFVAHEVLGDNAIGIMAETPLLAPDETDIAADICEAIGAKLRLVDVNPLADPDIRTNPRDRCYLCKRLLFNKIKDEAEDLGFAYVCDGTNADDLQKYRPGIKALSELDVLSPLADVGFTKRDVVECARESGLSIWDRPSTPCLATRIPYDEPLEASLMRRIATAEEIFHSHGFQDVRVRTSERGRTARIEIYPLQLPRLVEPDLRRTVIKELHDLGFTYITVDLEGFRSGSMDL